MFVLAPLSFSPLSPYNLFSSLLSSYTLSPFGLSVGEGPFPGILDLYTFGGDLCEPRASLLASKGFAVLALAYYGYQDLPKTPSKHFDLEYFEEALTFLKRQPQVSKAYFKQAKQGTNAAVVFHSFHSLFLFVYSLFSWLHMVVTSSYEISPQYWDY